MERIGMGTAPVPRGSAVRALVFGALLVGGLGGCGDDGLVDEDSGVACAIDCDCPQGDACIDSRCTATATPTYCCAHAGCPSGERCVTERGTLDSCAECIIDCDCPQGQACSASGLCVATTEPTYCCDNPGCPLGESCVGETGEAGTCVECHTACDCPQGLACSNSGLCVATAEPTYCCDNAGCPAGEACVGDDGSSNVCAMPGVDGGTNPGTDGGTTPGTDAGRVDSGVDAGPVTTTVGGACTGACETCLTNYGGTFCTRSCALDSECPSGSHCAFADEAGFCMQDCTSDAQCTRTNYECFDHDSDSRNECAPVGNGAGAVGAPCTTTDDCGGGERVVCLNDTTGVWNGGHCSVTCGIGLACPAGDVCYEGICRDGCGGTTGVTCRAGYTCTSPTSGTDNFCTPAGTNTSATVGDPCAGIWDCSGGTDAVCDLSVPGGYCTLYCFGGLPWDACTTGSHCVDDGSGSGTGVPLPFPGLGAGICMATCSSTSECRGASGYTCANHGVDLLPSGSTDPEQWECWAP